MNESHGTTDTTDVNIIVTRACIPVVSLAYAQEPRTSNIFLYIQTFHTDSPEETNRHTHRL